MSEKLSEKISFKKKLFFCKNLFILHTIFTTLILRTVSIMKKFINHMNKNFAKIKELKQQQTVHFTKGKANLEIPLDGIQLLIRDSLDYFNPETGETDEENQIIERLQRNRQDLFQAEGIVDLLLKVFFLRFPLRFKKNQISIYCIFPAVYTFLYAFSRLLDLSSR